MAITKNDNIITFWCNSSGTHVTTFTLDYCDIVPCPFDPSWQCHRYSDILDGKDICMPHRQLLGTELWFQGGPVGWNTGPDWATTECIRQKR